MTGRTETVFALLPSPLLGAAVWSGVADELRAIGRQVLVAGVPAAPDGPGDVLAGFLAALPEHSPLVLVPHSNAGLYVPALTAERDVAAVVFVDAALPDEAAVTAMAPDALREQIAVLADPNGMLPPWTRWWPDAEVGVLFPSAAARAAVELGQPTVPLAYFDASLPVPVGWTDTPCAYLAFGDTYAQELAVAEARGWPTQTLAGNHLHMLWAPAEAGGAVAALAVSDLSR